MRGSGWRPRCAISSRVSGPGATNVFCASGSPISFAFLRRYPSPEDARGLGEQRMAAFVPSEPQLQRPQTGARAGGATTDRGGKPRRRARDGRSPADRAVLISALEPTVVRISELTIEIRHALDAHPDT
jgi:hypothetical protein